MVKREMRAEMDAFGEALQAKARAPDQSFSPSPAATGTDERLQRLERKAHELMGGRVETLKEFGTLQGVLRDMEAVQTEILERLRALENRSE